MKWKFDDYVRETSLEGQRLGDVRGGEKERIKG
jgi:hypothetical protein